MSFAVKPERETIYRLTGLSKSYGERMVLDIASLEIRRGDIFCLVGPSGAGKSTLLRLLNFLEAPTGGSLEFEGCDFRPGVEVPLDLKRRVTMVFQRPVLLDRSVQDNVTYYAIVNQATPGKIKLAATKADALAGNAINLTGADLTRSDVDAADKVTISAKDTSQINTIAIGVSASGGGAVGVALAANVIANTVGTFVTGSTLDTDSSLGMTSESSAIIRSLAIGVAGSGGFAVQVTAMGNVIANTVTSTISAGSMVTAAGDITLSAKDIAPDMTGGLMTAIGSLIPDDNPDPHDDNKTTRDKLEDALAGSPIDPTANILSLMVSVAATGGAAVNVALVGNMILNTVDAHIAGSTVHSTGGKIDIDALSKAGILSLTVGVAGSGGVAVNATGFGNIITNRVEAGILAGSRVYTDNALKGSIGLTATDSSQIRSLGISVAGTGGIAVGALIAANVITNSVAAEISGSSVTSGSTLSLAAETKSNILGLTVGVAGAGAGAGILSLTAAVITNTTTAAIVNEGATGSVVHATGAVTLSAKDTSEINTLAIGVAGAGGGAIGGAAAEREHEQNPDRRQDRHREFGPEGGERERRARGVDRGERGDVTADRDVQHQTAPPAFALVVFPQAPACLPGLHPHDGILAGVEIRAPVEGLAGNQKLVNLRGAAGEVVFADKG